MNGQNLMQKAEVLAKCLQRDSDDLNRILAETEKALQAG